MSLTIVLPACGKKQLNTANREDLLSLSMVIGMTRTNILEGVPPEGKWEPKHWFLGCIPVNINYRVPIIIVLHRGLRRNGPVYIFFIRVAVAP